MEDLYTLTGRTSLLFDDFMTIPAFSCTDAHVIIAPSGDTSLRRFALEAKNLGFDSIIAEFTGNVPEDCVIPVVLMACVTEETQQKAIRAAGKAAKTADLVGISAGDAGMLRGVVQSGSVSIIYGLASQPPGTLDHITARYAAERGVAVAIDLESLLGRHSHRRQRAIRSYHDVLRLHRKHRFPLVVGSGDHSYLGLRTPRAVALLCRSFGMEDAEIRAGFSSVNALLHPLVPVEVI